MQISGTALPSYAGDAGFLSVRGDEEKDGRERERSAAKDMAQSVSFSAAEHLPGLYKVQSPAPASRSKG